MQMMKIAVLTACAVCLAGCWTLSVYPLYTENDIVFDQRLIGAWGDTTGSRDGTWIFQQGENNAYCLVTREKDKPEGIFKAHLVHLGDNLFLDIYPDNPKKENEFYQSHLIPGHTFWKIAFEKKSMILAPLDQEWLEERYRNKTLEIACFSDDNVIIFTAPTAELQKFITTYAAEAFEDDPFVLNHINW